jgi:cysteine desulfuration protein SufE
MRINEIQDQIIEEFEFLGDDREVKGDYIWDIGTKLDPLDEQHMQDENLIKGCMSKVWLVSEFKDGKVVYHADSNTGITKGLISLLIRVLSEQQPKDIVDADLYFIERIGMSGFISSQRSNGFANMIKQMKEQAAIYQQQMSN